MKAIGFRIEPKAMHWAVVEGTVEAPILVASGTEKAPKGASEPEVLSWYRKRAVYFFTLYSPSSAGVRYTEPVSRSAGTNAARVRARIEGVVVECANSHGLKIITGALNALSSCLGTTSAKAYIEADDLRGIDLAALPDVVREATLAAVAALG